MEIRDPKEIKNQPEIKFERYDHDEDSVQQAISEYPEVALEENILTVGNEVVVGPLGEKIDILGIDTDLNTCVVEIKIRRLKRDDVKQVIKYAPYVANFDEERFEKEFHGTAEEFHQTISNQSEPDNTLNKNQRLLLVAPEVAPRTIHMIDWLQSQGVNIELILFTAYDHPTEQKAVLSTDKEEVDPDELPNKDVRMWNESGEKAKEYHLETQASQDTKSLIQALNRKIESKTSLEGPNWQQKNYISFVDENVRVKVRSHDKKVGLWFRYDSSKEFRQGSIKKRVKGVQQVNVNTENNRIEFDLAPDSDEQTLDSLVQFVSDEL